MKGPDTIYWMVDLVYLPDELVRFLTYVFIDDFGIFELIEATVEG